MTLTFENGKKLVIEADGNSRDNIYVQSIKLKGKTIKRNYITHNELTGGGRLVFRMGARPDLDRGTDPESYPYSMSTE